LNDHARLASFHACRWPASPSSVEECDARIGWLAVPDSSENTVHIGTIACFSSNRSHVSCLGNRPHVEPHEAVIPTTIRGFA